MTSRTSSSRTSRRLVGIAAGVVLVAAGCGGDDAPTADDLVDRLLTTEQVSDAGLGDGWQERRRESFEERAPEYEAIDTTSWCPDAADAGTLTDLTGDSGAVVEMDQDLGGVSSFHGVSEQLWSNGDAAKFVNAVRDAYDACVGAPFTVTDPEGNGTEEIEITISPLDSPDVGDDAVSMRTEVLQGPVDDPSRWTSRMIVARDGDTVMVLRQLEVLAADADPIVDDATWSDLVESAADALASD